MNPIQILPLEVVNQIAAGEVVERPAHLVKELIENSLDAGANDIQLDLYEGGRRLSLWDNGKGIEKDQLPLALTPHATSKIIDYQDLWSLSSFGFRGEALASISAVSQLRLVSKVKASNDAFQIQSQFGEIGPVQTAGGGMGTEIHLEQLFANVPARLKFLKSDSTEVGQIKNVLKALGLANPHVQFRIKIQGQLLWFWPEESLLERTQRILETKDLYSLEVQNQGVFLKALLSSPTNGVRNRKSLWLFVQNRWVQDKTLLSSILDAYRSTLMQGEYPLGALWIHVPPDEIDINIHPTKSEVKFLKNSEIYRLTHRAVRNFIESAPWLKHLDVKPKEVQNNQREEDQVIEDGHRDNNFNEVLSSVFSDKKISPIPLSFEEKELNRTQYKQKEWIQRESFPKVQQWKDYGVKSKEVPYEELGLFYDKKQNEYSTSKIEDHSFSSPHFEKKPPQVSEPRWSLLQVMAQVHQTYIVLQSQDQLILVDQHAAHERVIYERLMGAWKQGQLSVQRALLPLEIIFEPEEIEALLTYQETLQKCGFWVEAVSEGQALAVVARPSFVSDEATQKMLIKMAREIMEQGGTFEFEKSVSELLATVACHSAIRAGQALSFEEMGYLLKEMDTESLTGYCPHGRPVFIELTWGEIETRFGRKI